MPINHINLCASDVEALTRTLVAHLGFTIVQAGMVPHTVKVPNSGQRYAFLVDADGFYIVISQIDAAAGSAYPPGFHFAVMLATRDDVVARHEELRNDGYAPGDLTDFDALGASWSAFMFQAGDGLTIEVNSCSKQITALAEVSPRRSTDG